MESPGIPGRFSAGESIATAGRRAKLSFDAARKAWSEAPAAKKFAAKNLAAKKLAAKKRAAKKPAARRRTAR
jgi:hypothetical protein